MWFRLLFVGWCWSRFSIRFEVFTFHTWGLYQCTYIVNSMTMIHTSHLDVCMYFCIYACIMYVNIVGCDIVVAITSIISRDFLVRFFFFSNGLIRIPLELWSRCSSVLCVKCEICLPVVKEIDRYVIFTYHLWIWQQGYYPTCIY